MQLHLIPLSTSLFVVVVVVVVVVVYVCLSKHKRMYNRKDRCAGFTGHLNGLDANSRTKFFVLFPCTCVYLLCLR